MGGIKEPRHGRTPRGDKKKGDEGRAYLNSHQERWEARKLWSVMRDRGMGLKLGWRHRDCEWAAGEREKHIPRTEKKAKSIYGPITTTISRNKQS